MNTSENLQSQSSPQHFLQQPTSSRQQTQSQQSQQFNMLDLRFKGKLAQRDTEMYLK
jgi:hypothetical protein